MYVCRCVYIYIYIRERERERETPLRPYKLIEEASVV